MSKSMVFTYGRFNPPTLGHQHLLNLVIETAIEHNAEHSVFLSHTQNSKKDPLDWAFKNRILKLACPNVNIVEDPKLKTPFQALEQIAKDEFKTVFFIAGEDRILDFELRMTPYAKEWGIETFKVISSGPRNKFSSDISGISATKQRTLAMQNRFEDFCKGLPSNLPVDVQVEIYNKIKSTCVEDFYCGII